MPYPFNTADLTMWFDASQECFNGVSPDVLATDGEAVRRAVDQQSAIQFDQLAEANKPTWWSTPINGLPAIEGEGTQALKSTTLMSSVITASSFHVIAVIKATSFLRNSGTVWNNDNIVSDAGAYWSMFVRDDAGGPTINGYLYDTGAKTVSASITGGDTYVVSWRKSGGAMYLSVNGGAENSTVCGNIGSTAAALHLMARGDNYGFDGHVSELLIWDVSLSASDRDDNIGHLLDKYTLLNVPRTRRRQPSGIPL